jgi:hypothetical protein
MVWCLVANSMVNHSQIISTVPLVGGNSKAIPQKDI